MPRPRMSQRPTIEPLRIRIQFRGPLYCNYKVGFPEQLIMPKRLQRLLEKTRDARGTVNEFRIESLTAECGLVPA